MFTGETGDLFGSKSFYFLSLKLSASLESRVLLVPAWALVSETLAVS